MNVVESQRYSFGFWCWSPEHGPAWCVSCSGAFPGSLAFGLRGRTAEAVPVASQPRLGSGRAEDAPVPRLCVQPRFTRVSGAIAAARLPRPSRPVGRAGGMSRAPAWERKRSRRVMRFSIWCCVTQLLEQRKEGDGDGMGSASSSFHPTSSWELGCWIAAFPALHGSLRSLVPPQFTVPCGGQSPISQLISGQKSKSFGSITVSQL